MLTDEQLRYMRRRLDSASQHEHRTNLKAVLDDLEQTRTQLALAQARREREQAVLEAVAEWVGLDSGAGVFTRMAVWNKIRAAYAVLAAEQQLAEAKARLDAAEQQQEGQNND